jgi:predicted aspartyl protease
MGRIIEKVKVSSFEDVLEVNKGKLNEAEIRTVETEAIVDTGAAYLCLPPRMIEQLGLPYSHTRHVRTVNSIVQRRVFMGATITIQGRMEQMSVMENDQSTPPLIGYLVLEALDFVADPKSQSLMPNPEHEGKWVSDLY